MSPVHHKPLLITTSVQNANVTQVRAVFREMMRLFYVQLKLLQTTSRSSREAAAALRHDRPAET